MQFYTTGNAQPVADSLKQAALHGKSYDEKIKAWIRYLEDYQRYSNLEDMQQSCEEAMALARRHGDSLSLALIERIAGTVYYFKGKYDTAASYYYNAVLKLEKTTDKKHLAMVYNELGKLYRKTRDLERSLENYNKALSIYELLNDEEGIAVILNESGVVYEYKKDYEEASRRYNASLEIQKKRNDSVGISYSLHFLAGIYVQQKKYNQAKDLMREVLTIRQNLKDSFGLALTYADLGAAHKAAGEFDEATQYLLQSNRYAEKNGYPELMLNNYMELSGIAQKRADYQKALEYYQLGSALRDSIFSVEKKKQIEELNAKYNNIQKERTIERQQNRILLQRWAIAGILAVVVLLALLIYSQYKRYQLRKEAELKTALMNQHEQYTKKIIEAEETERQRMARDLHDGVGQMMTAARMNLSAFESAAPPQSQEQTALWTKIVQLVDDSCRELRHVSHNMAPHALQKNNLATAVRNFIEKLNKRDLRVQLYTEGLDERLDVNTEIVLYRVIQECVNNVIRHAGASMLDISITRDAEGIHATIEDNGKGFDTSDMEKFDGTGMKNIIARMAYLKGTAEFDSAPGRGTVVGLFVPLTPA